MSRDWTDAHRKVAEAESCRICSDAPGDAAHIVPRSQGGKMKAASIVELCREHHRQFDAHELDLLEHLTLEEQAEAVSIVGIERARMILAPSCYRDRRLP